MVVIRRMVSVWDQCTDPTGTLVVVVVVVVVVVCVRERERHSVCVCVCVKALVTIVMSAVPIVLAAITHSLSFIINVRTENIVGRGMGG